MRLYDSPRVTQDLDLAVKTLDIERIVATLYELGHVLVVEVDERAALSAPDPSAANRWIESDRPGSLTFIAKPATAANLGDRLRAEHTVIDIQSQVDVLYELSVPFPRLRSRAGILQLAGTPVAVASPQDLIVLKEARRDRSPADDYDIAYLRRLLQSKQ